MLLGQPMPRLLVAEWACARPPRSRSITGLVLCAIGEASTSETESCGTIAKFAAGGLGLDHLGGLSHRVLICARVCVCVCVCVRASLRVIL